MIGAVLWGQVRFWQGKPSYGDREIPLPCVSLHRGAGCGDQTVSAKAGRTVGVLALEP